MTATRPNLESAARIVVTNGKPELRDPNDNTVVIPWEEYNDGLALTSQDAAEQEHYKDALEKTLEIDR
ncbi:MAG: hypothetical protein AB7E51_15070 [Pseudodesulfovibrio sp.]|uniref:hypothetical protein n=1 Tax=Pseudodesulfovibrio sp. TaxID=2035812 RepID=UPI003D13CF0A